MCVVLRFTKLKCPDILSGRDPGEFPWWQLVMGDDTIKEKTHYTGNLRSSSRMFPIHVSKSMPEQLIVISAYFS
jgi:hypothetical protein